MKKEKRFIKIYHHGGGFTGPETYILVDNKTGVNYLYVANGYNGGVTPLLDRDGKPVVSAVPVEEK